MSLFHKSAMTTILGRHGKSILGRLSLSAQRISRSGTCKRVTFPNAPSRIDFQPQQCRSSLFSTSAKDSGDEKHGSLGAGAVAIDQSRNRNSRLDDDKKNGELLAVFVPSP